MPIDPAKLAHVHHLAGGAIRAQCPACKEIGQDKSGQHLFIWPDGRYGCAAFQKDHEHRARIWQLACGAEAKPVARAPVQPDPPLDVRALLLEWGKANHNRILLELADVLGVKASALIDLGVLWCQRYGGWAFPMHSGFGQPIGIQLRSDEGVKWCVKGSHGGIFIPQSAPRGTVLLPEGASATAAALSLGFYAIGRFNASSGLQHVKTAIARLGIKRAVIIADNDVDREGHGQLSNPGGDGACSLARQLTIPTANLVLPVKDLREFIKCGATGDDLQDMIDQLVWDVKDPNIDRSYLTPKIISEKACRGVGDGIKA